MNELGRLDGQPPVLSRGKSENHVSQLQVIMRVARNDHWIDCTDRSREMGQNPVLPAICKQKLGNMHNGDSRLSMLRE